MSRQLREQRAGLVAQSRAIHEAAEAENRDLTAEELERFNQLLDQADELRARYEREERLDGLDNSMPASSREPNRPQPGGGQRAEGLAGIEWRSRGMRDASIWEPGELPPAWRALEPYATEDYHAGFRSFLRYGRDMPQAARRALQADSDTLGGFLTAPVQFADQLIQAMDNLVFIRDWSTTWTVPNADSLGAPSLDADPADPAWTSEIATGDEDSTMAFGRRELTPKPLAKRIKVSRKLIRQVPDVEGLVRARLAYKAGVTAENAYQNGTGANQPLGVFTASAQGINTDRDVSTGNTTTEIKFDGLIEAKYSIKAQYWPSARWLFHRDGVKMISKLKDGEGQYIWRESVRVGEPDRILGHPVGVSEYCPHTFTTGLYVGMFGDFGFYWIADALDLEIQALFELYAATNQVGYILRLESDGMPVLSEAFARVTLA